MGLEVNIKKKLKNFTLKIQFETELGIRGILGASGCGKSMTLKAIAGLVTPDEGRIVLNGKVLFDSKQKINLPPQKRKVGYLFQNYALFPNMTVEENIMVGLLGNKREKAKKVSEMIQLFNLHGLEKQYPNRLSGGQQQRVAFARLLAYDPEVMLLDEPFSALDSCLKEQLQVQIKEILKRYKKTVLMVSHDRMEIYRLCDEIMTMKNGVVLQKGTTKEVFDAPREPITARLMGYRNLSTVRWINEQKLEAVDWNVQIEDMNKQDRPLVAIHERNLVLKERQEGEKNHFPVQIINIFEDLYEYQILVDLNQKVSKKEDFSYLWTIVRKGAEWDGMEEGTKAWVYIPEDKLIFLEDSRNDEKRG